MRENNKVKHTRTEYSIINILTGFGGYFVNFFMGYICRIVFVRCLATEYLGISGLFSNILSMLSLAELGIGMAMGFALYKPIAENDEEKIASLMKVYANAYKIIGLMVAICGIAIIPFLNLLIKETPNIIEPIELIYCIYLFNTASSYFFSYRGALLSAEQRHYIVLGVNYAITILQSVLQIPVLILTKKYLPYLLIQTIGVFLNNIIVSQWAKHDYPFICKKDVKPLNKAEKKSLLVNVKALTINKLSTILVNSTDYIVITYLRGLVTVGLASNYTLLVDTLSSLIAQVFNSLTASVGNLNASENVNKRKGFFDILNLSNFWIYGWAAIGIALVSGDIIKICFGENYVLNLNISIILAINFYIAGMQSSVLMYKTTMGLFRYGQYLLLLTAAINLILDFLLGSYWGIFGIYLASIVARLLTNVWYEAYAVFKYGFNSSPKEYYKKYIKYIMILAGTGTICYMLCSLCDFNVFINVVVKFVICSVVPNMVFIFVFHRKPEYIYLSEAMHRIVHKILCKLNIK